MCSNQLDVEDLVLSAVSQEGYAMLLRSRLLDALCQGDEPKFPLSTKHPKENGLRYALLVYENRDISDLWGIAKHIAKREWRERKLGLTSNAFDYASPEALSQKQDAEERSYRKRYTQSKVGRYKRNAEMHLNNVCKGIFP